MARGKSTVVSSLARTESLSVLLQTGPRRQARGPNASTKVEPANDPPFSTLCAHPKEHPARDEQSLGWLPAVDGGGGWATPIQSQRIRLHAT